MKDVTSRAIQAVRFPLVMLVLIVHCHPEGYPYAIPVQEWAGHSVGEILFSSIAYLLAWFGPVAVPVFFMLSGFLFFTHLGENWHWDIYLTKLKKRVKTLLVPYILFNLLAIASALCCGDPGWRNPDTLPILGYFWDSTTFCVGMKNWFGLDMQLFYPEVIPLWFVRDLMFMCIISPIVWFTLKKAPKLTLGILSLVYLSGLGIGANGYNSQALMFFSLGAYFSIHGKDMMARSSQQLKRTLPLTLILLVIATIWNSLTHAQQVNHALYLCGSFVVLGLAYRWAQKSEKKVYPLLSDSSFFVYALHMCSLGGFSFLNFCPGTLRGVIGAPDNFISAFLGLILNPLAVAACCMAIYVALKKICPPLLSLFTGGR